MRPEDTLKKLLHEIRETSEAACEAARPSDRPLILFNVGFVEQEMRRLIASVERTGRSE